MARTKNGTAKDTEIFDKFVKENSHLNVQQIADKFSKHRTTVYKSMKRNNIKKPCH